MKRFVITLIAGILILSVTPTHVQAKALTRSFKISITIPAVIGVNVFPDGSDTTKAKLAAPQTDLYESSTFRDGEPVLVRSAVVK